jgi:transcription elongation GreA/GreB family factor
VEFLTPALRYAIAPAAPLSMNKPAVIQAIVTKLGEELAVYLKAAQASREEATHESSKAENKYDTRGLEASYLARGQSRQIAELEAAVVEFQKLGARNFAVAEPIDVGALVELEQGKVRSFYFIGPRAGGTEVEFNSHEILVITPQSPLGAQLFGKQQGDLLKLTLPGSQDKYRVVSVK